MKLNRIITLSCFASLSFYSTSSSALVDYSEPEASGMGKKAKGPSKRIVKRALKRTSRSAAPSGMFSVSSGYEHLTVKSSSGESSVTKLTLNGHFQTDYNIYLDFNYWTAKSDELSLSKNSDIQNGNPELSVGFNWLKFGERSELATIDLYGGVQMDSSDPLGSSRTDKFAGITTTKRFNQFVLGIGYEFRMSGMAKSEYEYRIGNIGILKGNVGWMISSDIQFAIEVATLKVAAGDEGDFLRLTEDQTYSYIAPVLGLGISPSVQVELGAVFQTNKPKNIDELIGARLFSLDGVYGNSLKAGLNISI